VSVDTVKGITSVRKIPLGNKKKILRPKER